MTSLTHPLMNKYITTPKRTIPTSIVGEVQYVMNRKPIVAFIAPIGVISSIDPRKGNGSSKAKINPQIIIEKNKLERKEFPFSAGTFKNPSFAYRKPADINM
jgi:hypothetical protein